MTDKIKILNDRQQAREKLPIFFGSRDNYKHGLKELIANAIDELKNNKNDRENVITVTRESDSRITVKDNGRGIPIEGKTDGVPNFELLFLKLFAGTKYDVTESITTGTNGVGNTVLCYTSKEMVVESVRGGKKYRIEFLNGGAKNSGLIVLDNKDDDKGTSITFSLDDDVYTKTKFTIDEIDEIVFNYSLATENIIFRYIYTKDNEEFVKEYVHSNVKDYFEKDIMPTSTSGLFTLGKVGVEHDVEVIKETGTQSEVEKNSYNIILTTTPEVTQKSYLNNTYLEEGGTIHDGILDSVRLHLNKHCRDKKLFPNKVTAFNKDDVNSSISFIAIAESNNVEFSNQTKLSTNKKQYEQDVKGYINNLLDAAKISQPKEFDKLVKHILEVQKYNTNNDRARERLKKKLTEKVEGIGNKVEKLIDCEKHGLDSELYITEGDSAMGSIIDARDDDFQATYPLRGKMLNTLKADVARVFKNQEIVDLVKIIGTGIYGGKKDGFNIDNLRYGKIIISCFTGDTTIKMADGSLKTFEELVEIHKGNPDYVSHVYSLDSDGNPVVGSAKNPRITGYTKSLVKITLDDGQEFKCTPDHMWMDRDGNYIMAKDLYEGQSLMPLYTKINDNLHYNNGIEKIKNNNSEEYVFMHHLSYDSYNDNRYDERGKVVKGKQVHHIDGNRKNNDPRNLKLLETEYHKLISHYQWREAGDKWLDYYNGSNEQRKNMIEHHKKGTYDNATWANTYNGSEKHINAVKKAWCKGRCENSTFTGNGYNHSEKHNKVVIARNKDRKVINSIKRNRVLSSIKFMIINNITINEDNWSRYKKINAGPFSRILDYFDDLDSAIKYISANLNNINMKGYKSQWESKKTNHRDEFNNTDIYCRDRYDYNHKVKKIEFISLDEDIPVYCMTVEEYGNFAISNDNISGVYVKNCDADPDGYQIAILVLTFIYKFLRPLLYDGHVYIAQTPLYELKFKDDSVVYFNSEDEKNKNIKKYENKKYVMNRLKGLGEVDAITMHETAMNPETRNLVRISVDDAEEAERMLLRWMDTDVKPRKEMINNQLADYIDLTE